MSYRKKTLRTMSPTARKVARLAGELQSTATRLKNLIPDLQRLDLESAALLAQTPNQVEQFIPELEPWITLGTTQEEPTE